MDMFDEVNRDRGDSPVCLAFANTLRWHASDHPKETLHSYADLVAWARGAALVSEREEQQLLRDAAARPAEAGQAFHRALALREAIYRIFVALIHAGSPDEADLSELNATLAQITTGARVVRTPKGWAWQWSQPEEALDGPIGLIARSAAELLISEQRERVGQCADDRGCGWLFLDTSKNRRRRWCDISDCGNRAKQRRRYQRVRTRT
jgi:predicted RNA-binding Zn ribbon-like protein